MAPVTLRTARLVLSVPTEADVDAIFEACQDAGIQRYTTVPSPYERRHAEGFIPYAAKGWDEERETTWAIREQGVLAGMIGIAHLGEGAGEIGYWMAAGSRGRGLLTEAAGAVIDWAFGTLELRRLEWRAVAGNVPSARAARALGFHYEGLLRQALVSHSGREDGWVAALLPTDDRMPQPWPPLED